LESSTSYAQGGIGRRFYEEVLKGHFKRLTGGGNMLLYQGGKINTESVQVEISNSGGVLGFYWSESSYSNGGREFKEPPKLCALSSFEVSSRGPLS